MQRLLIMIPLLLVVLSGCGNTPTGLTGPGEDTLGGTVVDSDNDPITPAGGTCDVTYYNTDFSYGFDLPNPADLMNFDDEQDFLFNARWALDAWPDEIHITTRVQDLTGIEPVSLPDFVELVYSSERDNGYVFLTETLIALSNGDSGSLSIIVAGSDSGAPVVMYRVITMKHDRTYIVSGLEVEEDLTTSTDALLTGIVLSLCVE